MAQQPLQIGPIRIDEAIAPAHPDEVGMIAGPAGARYDALEIIERVGADAARLGPALALPPDMERTLVIQESLDYVQEVLDDELDSDAGELSVEGASVRGTGSDERKRIVVYTVRAESGRSTKGVMPYAKFPQVESAVQEKRDRDLDAARAARSTGSEEHGEDPKVATLQKALDAAEARAREAERKAAEAAEAAEAEAADPEPYEGFADASADNIREYLDSVTDPLDRELLKRQVRVYEEGHKNRKGVMALTEPVDLVPADQGQPSTEDPE